MAKICSVCGNTAFGFYGMCKSCMDKKAKGLLEKCDCGAWKEIGKPCISCGQVKEEKQNQEVKVNNDNNNKKNAMSERNTCLICGEETDGFHFCRKCYYKYSQKEIILKITNCSHAEVLESSYTGNYHCKDGHIVKSLAEKIIDDYLYDNAIKHAYEKALPIDNNPAHDLHPDFCLENYKGMGNVYIEHWGFENGSQSYNDSEEYKLKIYKEQGITLICTYSEDTKDITTSLDRKLSFLKPHEINGLKK